jgi:conjugative transfer signal peptidase TraF
MVEDRNLPLFAWGDDRCRADRTRRSARHHMLVVAGMAASIALASTIALPPHPRLVWNASASAPVGLYWVTFDTPRRRGDMVVAWVPTQARLLAARRRYLPANIPLVKRVAAVEGDTVCAIGPVVSINGMPVVERRRFDGARRVLPWWQGCVTLRPGQLFLLMADATDSFDGRYFGPTDPVDIVGRARLIQPKATRGSRDA